MVTRQKMSVAEYLAIPEDEAPYFEYLDGEVVQKMAPDFRHMVVTKHIIVALDRYEAIHGGVSGPEGRVEFTLRGATYFRLPDVAYWAPDRQVKGERAMVPPTLAIEISSPGQSIPSLRDKCRQFREAGVEVCWLFDLEHRVVEVFDASLDGEVRTSGHLESPALPGFALTLEMAFALLDR
jgi:Uma2 family endonuclease